MYPYPICKTGSGSGFLNFTPLRISVTLSHPYPSQIFQPPAVLAHRRTRCAAAALFTVSCTAFPPFHRARAKIRPCAPLLTHHPAVPIQSFYSPVLKFPISTLAARPLPGRRRRRPSAPLQVLLAPLLRAGDLCSVLVCSQVCLPVAATVGRGFTPTVISLLLLGDDYYLALGVGMGLASSNVASLFILQTYAI